MLYDRGYMNNVSLFLKIIILSWLSWCCLVYGVHILIYYICVQCTFFALNFVFRISCVFLYLTIHLSVCKCAFNLWFWCEIRTIIYTFHTHTHTFIPTTYIAFNASHTRKNKKEATRFGFILNHFTTKHEIINSNRIKFFFTTFVIFFFSPFKILHSHLRDNIFTRVFHLFHFRFKHFFRKKKFFVSLFSCFCFCSIFCVILIYFEFLFHFCW